MVSPWQNRSEAVPNMRSLLKSRSVEVCGITSTVLHLSHICAATYPGYPDLAFGSRWKDLERKRIFTGRTIEQLNLEALYSPGPPHLRFRSEEYDLPNLDWIVRGVTGE
jgi:hypothetical protein